ncbi:MAG TPA: HEXXH motif-containing putative peptide modification protein [Rhodanobacter sp.]|nr:HEXXH motif-containing putative peptide modification protein [Rhodanobacter sp.]
MRPCIFKDATNYRGVLGQLLCETIEVHITVTINRVEPVSAWESPLSFIEENFDRLNPSNVAVSPGIAGIPFAEDEWTVALVRIAMLFVTMGGKGQWSVYLSEHTSTLAYLGCHPIPFMGNVQVISDGRTCQIRSVSGAWDFARHADAWINMRADETLVVTQGTHVVVFGGEHAFEDATLTGGLSLSSSPAADMRASLTRALNAIGASYPEGLRWMSSVLSGVVFVDTRDGSTTSGSSSSHPGLIYVSHPIHDHHLAAQLIHECAHQYLSLLHARFELVPKDCVETYYSPFKRNHRPLYNVLLALHAAINIRELAGRMIEAGLRSDYLVVEHDRLAAEIDQMYGDVRNSSAWTAIGRTFVWELCEALATEELANGQ